MTIRDKQTLKGYFTDGNVPNQEEYADLIDSLIDGTQLGVDFSKILLITPSTFTIIQYDISNAGFAEALADSVSGDVIHIPIIEITGNYTIPEDVMIQGFNRRFSILSGIITLSAGSRLNHLRCEGVTADPPPGILVIDDYTHNESVELHGDGTRHIAMLTSGGYPRDEEHTWSLNFHYEPRFTGPKTIRWKISGSLTSLGGFGPGIEIDNAVGNLNVTPFESASDHGTQPSMDIGYNGINEFDTDQWNTCVGQGGGQAYGAFLSQTTFSGTMEFSLDDWDVFYGNLAVIGPDSGKAIISDCDIVSQDADTDCFAIKTRSGAIDIINSYLYAQSDSELGYCVNCNGSGVVQIFHSRLHGSTDWFDSDIVNVYSVVEGGSDV